MENLHPIFFPRLTTEKCERLSTLMADVKSAATTAWADHGQRWFARLLAVAVVASAFLSAAGSAGAAPVFTLTNAALPGVGYSSVVCGDFNNDGRSDALLTGANTSFNGICQVWQNQANGVFTNFNAALPGLSNNAVSSSAVAMGDFDNDGRPDFLITGFAGVDANSFPIYLSQVWRNLGNGSFTNIQAGLPGVDTGAVAFGDFDNDGNLDILLTGYSSTGAVAQVWRNRGNGTFTNINAGLPGVIYGSVALGDYDNDGHLDILLAGTTNGFGTGIISQLWRNLGNGIFTNISVNLPGVTQGVVAWGDFNQDGWLDILLTGSTQTGTVCQVWRNLGNGTFTNMNAGLPGVYQSSVALADYDNDGKLDILLAGVNTQTNLICQVWRNTGNWVFTNLNAGFPGVHFGSVAWADFDNDRRLDLLLSGLDTNSSPILQVYHNNTPLTNSLALRINSLKSLGNQGRQISFGGQSGFDYRVWASTNLVQWTALGVPNQSGPATFQFTDRATTNLSRRFYRASTP